MFLSSGRKIYRMRQVRLITVVVRYVSISSKSIALLRLPRPLCLKLVMDATQAMKTFHQRACHQVAGLLRATVGQQQYLETGRWSSFWSKVPSAIRPSIRPRICTLSCCIRIQTFFNFSFFYLLVQNSNIGLAW